MRRSNIAKVLLLFAIAAVIAGALFSGREALRNTMSAILTDAGREPQTSTAGQNGVKEPEDREQANEVRLTPEQISLIGLTTAAAEQRALSRQLFLNGEIEPNQDLIGQVLPKTAGIVREIKKSLGDHVLVNELLAVVDSRELAEAVASYLAARSKAELADTQFRREETLWQKKVSAESDYLTAKQAATESAVALRGAEQKLSLLGLKPSSLADRQPADSGSAPISVTAPFEGTIIEKRVAVGDQVTDQTALFRIANLDRVWVIAHVFEKDMGSVALDQAATVTVRAYPDRGFEGKITWISEIIDESTRTLKIRVELDNPQKLLKPGSFAHVALSVPTKTSGVTVPSDAVQRQKSESIVFVDAGGGTYKRRLVKTGVRSPETVEVTEGLTAGEQVVTNGSFLLKSELEKSSFGDSD